MIADDVPFAAELSVGESVAVNGCCLTVVEAGGGTVKFDLLQQTLRLTNLGSLASGDAVNLERAMPAGGRFSGHFVQGHIDATGRILTWESNGQDFRLDIEIPADFRRFLIPRGSIAIDGISLTIAALEGPLLSVTIIPHTYRNTTLGGYRPGAKLNLECDVLAKHVEKLLRKLDIGKRLTVEDLKAQGY